MKRTIMTSIMLALLVAAPVSAQQTATPTQEKASEPVVQKTMADGLLKGQALAEMQGTSGSFIGGFAGGVFLGLIGTAIAYVAQGASTLPVTETVEASKYSAEYQIGVQTGFADKTRKKKRNSALAGGLIGTATIVAVFLSSGN